MGAPARTVRLVRGRARRGNAAITAISLGVLLGFGALAVDVAYVRVINAQLAAAVDAAVLGGSAYLDGTAAGAQTAVERAVTIGNANAVAGGFALTAAHVELGRYTEADGFVAYGGTIDDDAAEQINAMRVDVSHDGIASILAGAAFGRATLRTDARALAYRRTGGPAAEVECYLPIALPDCNFPETPTVNPDPIHITFGNALQDNVGWADPNNANVPNVLAQLNGFCTGDSIGVGDLINLQNGVATSAVSYVAGILNNNGTGTPAPWPVDLLGPVPTRGVEPDAFAEDDTEVTEPNWGTVIGGPIALVAMGGEPDSCAGTDNFNQDREITGFTWGYLYDARMGNASEKGFMLQLDFTNEYELGTRGDPDARGNVISSDEPPILVSL